jgi:hypothetical protein
MVANSQADVKLRLPIQLVETSAPRLWRLH